MGKGHPFAKKNLSQNIFTKLTIHNEQSYLERLIAINAKDE